MKSREIEAKTNKTKCDDEVLTKEWKECLDCLVKQPRTYTTSVLLVKLTCTSFVILSFLIISNGDWVVGLSVY